MMRRAAAIAAIVVVAGSARAQGAQHAAALDASAATLTRGARESFMTSLVATPAGTHAVRLRWSGEPGAERYEVLRAATLRGPWVNITPAGIRGDGVAARALPGIPLVFRVVAVRGGERDTTSVAYVTVRKPARGTAGAPRMLECAARAPSSLALTWAGDLDADLYLVQLFNDAPPAPRTLLSVRTADTTFVQTGLPAGRTIARVTAVYALPDFPAPGDTAVYARDDAAFATGAVSFPIVRSQSCK